MMVHLLNARIESQIFQHCSVCSIVMGRLEHCREERNKNKGLSHEVGRLFVWLVEKVLRHQREIHQTFKGTEQRGVLADCWFGQLAYLTTQPQLTDKLT